MNVSARCSTKNQLLRPTPPDLSICLPFRGEEASMSFVFIVVVPVVIYRHCIKVLTYKYKYDTEDEVILG